MKTIFRVFAFIVLFFFLLPVSAQVNNDLLDLAKVKEGVKSRRISSYDRSGGNNDRFEGIEDGETKTLFDVKGAENPA